MKILAFIHPRRGKCSECGKFFIKALASNNPAYCQYKCGATAQPEHTQAQMDGTFSGGRGA